MATRTKARRILDPNLSAAPPDPPTVVSRTIDAAGTSYTIIFSEAVSGTTGITITVGGSSRTITYSSGNGTDTYVFSIANAVGAGQTVTDTYTPGNIVSVATGAALQAFSGESVTNNSAAFAIVSGETVGGSATLIELVFSDLVNIAGPGGSQFTTEKNGTQSNNYDPSGDIGVDSGGDGLTNWVRLTLANPIGIFGNALTVSFTAGFFTKNVDGLTDPYAAAVLFPITNNIPV
jgi:hypothetical protein